MLTINPDQPNTVLFKGEAVGEITTLDGTTTVTLSMSYSCDGDLWIVPLSHFAQGLAQVEPAPPQVVADISTSLDDIDWVPNRLQFLIEKTIQAGGRWRFHKNDVDPWPSSLHGHDYERGLVIDGITGEFFDSTHKQYQGKLRPKDLCHLHKILRETSDLEHLIHLLPPVP